MTPIMQTDVKFPGMERHRVDKYTVIRCISKVGSEISNLAESLLTTTAMPGAVSQMPKGTGSDNL